MNDESLEGGRVRDELLSVFCIPGARDEDGRQFIRFLLEIGESILIDDF